MRATRRRMLPFLLGGLARRGAGASGERSGARDRGQGGPADPRVAVQLDGGDRARGLVRGALDAVDDARSCRSSTAAGWYGCRRALEWLARRDRGGAVRAGRLQRLRRRAGRAGELLGDVHLRRSSGSACRLRACCSATSSVRSARGGPARGHCTRSCALIRARARRARRRCAIPSGSGCGRRSPGSSASPGWSSCTTADRDRPSTLAALSLGYFLVMLVGMMLFGVEEWGGQADGFGAYFNLLSRLSALVQRRAGRRLPAPAAERRSRTCRSARARSR